MKGKLFIDGTDAYVKYGVFVEKQGLKGLVQMPAFKKLDAIMWPEHDGEEVDLTAPVLDAKAVQLPLVIVDAKRAELLFNDLSNGAYHEFRFVELNRPYRLRMTTNNAFSRNVKLGKITLSFSDDFPKVPTGSPYPNGKSGVTQSGYTLDGVDFSQFGAYVLDGTDTAVRKLPNVQSALSVSVPNVAGVTYDAEGVKFQSKDVAVSLLIKADTVAGFWRRYDSLFAALLKPDSHKFRCSEVKMEYDCHYKGCSISKFEILRQTRVWCEFTVTLTFTSWQAI
jgi:hypothetical protein